MGILIQLIYLIAKALYCLQGIEKWFSPLNRLKETAVKERINGSSKYWKLKEPWLLGLYYFRKELL